MRLIVFTFIISFFMVMQSCSTKNLRPEKQIILDQYKGPIEHLFFHSLIAYPEITFKRSRYRGYYKKWFITAKEFRLILHELYKRNFILIPHDIMYTTDTEDGKDVYIKKNVFLPPGKQPLIISVDDLNYDSMKKANGFIHRIILNKDNKIASCTRLPDGKMITGNDNNIISIMENFISQHPDFSFRGARGIIGFTGKDGILGYPVHKIKHPQIKVYQKQASMVLEKLKDLGWVFASHSYYHYSMASISFSYFHHDLLQWEKVIRPLVGNTKIFIYPFGDYLQRGSYRHRYMMKYFTVFYGVNFNSRYYISKKSIYFNRIPVDENFLKGLVGNHKKFMNIRVVRDPLRK